MRTGWGRLRFKPKCDDSRARHLKHNTAHTRMMKMRTGEGTRQKQNQPQSEGLWERKLGCMNLPGGGGFLITRSVSNVSWILSQRTFYMHSAGLVQPTDSFSAAFSAMMLELENDPMVQADPGKRTLRSLKFRNERPEPPEQEFIGGDGDPARFHSLRQGLLGGTPPALKRRGDQMYLITGQGG